MALRRIFLSPFRRLSFPRVLVVLSMVAAFAGGVCGVGGEMLPFVHIPPQDAGDWLNLFMFMFGLLLLALALYDMGIAILSSYPRPPDPDPDPEPSPSPRKRSRSPVEDLTDTWTPPPVRKRRP